jgi:hypothetical protein
MKQLATTLLFGKDARFSGLIALSIVAAIALGCTCGKNFGDLGNVGSNSNSTTTSNTTTEPPDADGIPSDTTLQAMIKETTADFAQAIDTNDFKDIYEKSSTDFQKTYTEEQMKNVFKTFVTKKKFILPSINKVPGSKGEFSPPPTIRTENGLEILVLNGKFPTKPLAVKFEYEYVKRGGQWKLLKLIINM